MTTSHATKRIVLSSLNPIKAQATLGAFQQMFPDLTFDLEQVNSSSGVSDQPMSHAETLAGACNRAENAQLIRPDADFWVGIEGGVEETNGQLSAFAWMVVKSHNLIGKSCSASFLLPPKVAQLVREGIEMGTADDIVFKMTNSKQQLGASGILTHQVINRSKLYEHALILALIPFKNLELYS